jgi:myo-inositol 2-dehydrogenase / D-chiro-inositol 1-dehydrogenase
VSERKETVRVAIIGCGNMGRLHARLLGKLPDAEVALLVDPVPEASERLRQDIGLPGVPSTTDPGAAFADEHIDAVVIATHHDLHVPLAVAAARAGKHLLVEKPLALTLEGCRAIGAAVEAAGVQLVVGFQARHSPYVRRARQAIPQPRVLIGNMIDPRWGEASWAQHPRTGGGNVLSQGVHTLDLLCHLADDEPVALHAEGGAITHDPAASEVIDTVVATLRFAGGAVASLAIGDFGPSPRLGKSSYQLFDAAGSSATIYRYYDGVLLGRGREWLDYGPEGVARVQTTGLPTGGSREDVQAVDPATPHLSALERADPVARMGYAGELAEFVACARENRPPTVAAGWRDGRRATQLALVAFESIRTGQTVRLSAGDSVAPPTRAT